ncbi:MAG: hypothetical protein GY807_18675 [Gammaproteobacteria bacterium]|nr:hypothetical protein [Gammaproteobacteria bacterium]
MEIFIDIENFLTLSLYDVAGRWRYNLIQEGPWDIKLGAGINTQIVEVELGTVDKSV